MAANDYFAQSRRIWEPRNQAFTNVEVFRRAVNRKRGLELKDYHDLYKYSVENYTFWDDLWQYLGVVYSVSPEKVIENGSADYAPVWFPGARLNYAENLLRHNDDRIACTAIRDFGQIQNYSFRRLRQLVAEMVAAMRVNGLTAGDRVAAIVTNSIDAIVIGLATASIGGIYTATSTDMGAQGILDRYRQILPRFVFAETEVMYAGRTVDLIPKMTEVLTGLADKGLRLAILLPSTITGKEKTLSGAVKNISLVKFLATGDGRDLVFEQLPFNHPLCILYSSGTSGPPKCIVHSAGGILLQNMKDLVLHFSITPNDTLFQFTTTSWMMWTLMISGLAWGTRIIAYDGSPFYPDLQTFLKLVSREHVSVLSVSPRFLAEVQGQSIDPLKLTPFEALRVILSGGSVLTATMFEWATKAFGGCTRVTSGMGGTDVCSSFVGGTDSLPVYAGEMSCKTLGMKVEVFDEDGRNIEHTGRPGELVVTRPHPSIPLCFWGDSSGKKLRKAYFDKFPGVWHQGDFMVVNPTTKGIMILGRSDGVLNPSGIRFGSGEIYSVLDRFSESVAESLCVGQRRPTDKDERVLLFVKMRPGHSFTEVFADEIRRAIKEHLSPRHVPAFIFPVDDIPCTVNGKKIEIAVKQIVSGSDVKPSGTVANPEALRLYYKYRNIEVFARKPGAKL